MQQDIETRLLEAHPDARVQVEVEGNRVAIHIVSSAFAGLSRVQKQQRVYAVIEEMIADGRLHAVSIRADAPADSL